MDDIYNFDTIEISMFDTFVLRPRLRTCEREWCLRQNYKMASTFGRKIPYKQDMPRAGGYPAIEYARNLPKRGVSGVAMFLGCGVVMSYGFYTIIMGNRKLRELEKETMAGRIALMPILQAEYDRRLLREMKDNYEEEALIMKDVKDWKVGESVYHTKRWVPPVGIEIKQN